MHLAFDSASSSSRWCTFFVSLLHVFTITAHRFGFRNTHAKAKHASTIYQVPIYVQSECTPHESREPSGDDQESDEKANSKVMDLITVPEQGSVANEETNDSKQD
ncbi:hypothetical protein DEO72_LG1g3049 [Vigna unguiculata]|uniref:Uncharacterized protein n=1 Tax=Vigna unguiculata TaxID=3917 RepID=A0A4D6KVU5_VIGUN|nr:hypothetical protein DEO72_LG1g3049 [Vigna unguiculata]